MELVTVQHTDTNMGINTAIGTATDITTIMDTGMVTKKTAKIFLNSLLKYHIIF